MTERSKEMGNVRVSSDGGICSANSEVQRDCMSPDAPRKSPQTEKNWGILVHRGPRI